MAEITFHIENIEVPDHDPEFLVSWICGIAKELNRSIGKLSYIFCSDDYILDINKQYLGHDYYTDIITFNYNQNRIVCGDIFISVDTVRSNAVEYSDGDFVEELRRVIIHGVLHLFGYNDKSDAEQKEMTRMEDWALGLVESFT